MTLRLKADDASVRPRYSAAAIRGFLPAGGATGPFTFPDPYGTAAVRLTNAADGTIEPVGYAYWPNANNHAGQDRVFIALGRTDAPGLLLEVDKSTLAIVSKRDLPIRGTGEGWRFSFSKPFALYVTEGPVLFRLDVRDFSRETVLDLREHGYAGHYLWQTHSSADDRIHSATLRLDGTWGVEGALVYDEATKLLTVLPKRGDDFDEAQIDKSGRVLFVKEGADLRIVDLATGSDHWLLDAAGAPGHSDCGELAIVGEDDRAADPGSFRLWRISAGAEPIDGRVVYRMVEWANMSRHISWPPRGARALVSCAHRDSLPRANELVLTTLDGSLDCEVIAPNLVDLDAPSGGDDYRKLPKANVDPSGVFAVWTANGGTDRLDAFLVRLDAGVASLPPAGPILPPDERTDAVNGLISRLPYPSDMSDPIAVSQKGTTLTLITADDKIQTQNGDGTGFRPSQPGDVLSLQPSDGGWQGRPPGAAGAFEQFAVNGALAVYCPLPDRAQARAFLYWPQVPTL